MLKQIEGIERGIYKVPENQSGLMTVGALTMLMTRWAPIDVSMVPALPSALKNRYIVWRHGQSEANAQEIIISKPENGIDNFGLTQLGVRQVRRTAMLAKWDRLIDDHSLIYSSPFLRCVQTANEIVSIIGIPGVVIADELRERNFGSLEGTGKEGYRKVYEWDRQISEHKLWGVESIREVSQRANTFISTLEARHTNRRIVLVTHADIGEILQAAFLGLPPETHRLLPKLGSSEPRELNFGKFNATYSD